MPLNAKFVAARDARAEQTREATRTAILAAVSDSHVPLTNSEIARAIGVHQTTPLKHLTALVSDGSLVRNGNLYSPATPVKRTAPRPGSRPYVPALDVIVTVAETIASAVGDSPVTVKEMVAISGYSELSVRSMIKYAPTGVFTLSGKDNRSNLYTVRPRGLATPTPPLAEILTEELSLFTTEELVTELFARLRRNVGL